MPLQTEAFYKDFVIYKDNNEPKYLVNFKGKVIVKDSLESIKRKIDIEERKEKWDVSKKKLKNM